MKENQKSLELYFYIWEKIEYMKLRLSFFFVSLFFFLSDSAAQMTFSHDAGFYDDPFDLMLDSDDASNEIIYTLDGSDPRFSDLRFTVNSGAKIIINPDALAGRAKTPAVVIRAILSKNGQFIGESTAKTYIFLENLKTQDYPGLPYPSASREGINDHFIDYRISTSISKGAEFGQDWERAFTSIPVVSISTEVGGLYHRDTGIYVNSFEHGIDWERSCSVEMIEANDGQKFQINAGLRLKGGWSRQIFNPKYSFRLLFKSEYGKAKLDYPLFGDDGAKSFNKLNLYTAQNMSWSLDWDGTNNTFIRDVFSRDYEKEIGHPYMRSEYVHLFLNGIYWGLYMTQENADGNFGEEYFDGAREDFDAIKVNSVIEGNDESWRKLWNLTGSGFVENESYFAVQGLDSEGKPMHGGEVLVDIDNLINYMILVFYTGNFDGPVSKWVENNAPNNFYVMDKRTDKSNGFQFYANDFEFSMFSDPIYNMGDGIWENRVNIGDISGDWRMNTTAFDDFNPQWLHHKLAKNAEYRMRFIDQVFDRLREDGELTKDGCLAKIDVRKKELEYAIIAESARWGDTHQFPPKDKNTWRRAVEGIEDEWCVRRPVIVLRQLEDVGLYNNVLVPRIEVSNQFVPEKVYHLTGEELVEINGFSTSTIYYTTDGSDPRAIGGSVGESAIEIAPGGKFEILTKNSMFLKARTKSGNEWSPLRALKILAAKEDFTNFKVTELNYHPLDEIVAGDTISGKDYEFIEFKNTGLTALNISGVRIDSAINFTVADNTILPAGAYFVVADKPSKFFDRYGRTPDGNFTSNFSNSGEFVLVEDADGNEILSFTYSDTAPWPEEADGDGPSLVSVEIDPTGDPNIPFYWKRSEFNNGNPFYSDGNFSPVNFIENEPSIRVFPNPTSGILNIDGAGRDAELKLTDISGKVILFQKNDGSGRLDLSELNLVRGMYFLSVFDGGVRDVFKVVLE